MRFLSINIFFMLLWMYSVLLYKEYYKMSIQTARIFETTQAMTQLVRKTNDDVIVWCSIVHLKETDLHRAPIVCPESIRCSTGHHCAGATSTSTPSCTLHISWKCPASASGTAQPHRRLPVMVSVMVSMTAGVSLSPCSCRYRL